MSPHPLESLRYVARAWEVGDEFPAQEVAAVLADLAAETPATLLPACRRMIEYFPASGPAWWLSARALASPDSVEGIWEAAEEMAEDTSRSRLAESLPPGAVVGFGRRTSGLAAALRRRSDITLLAKPARAELLVAEALAAGPAAVLVGSRVAELVESFGRSAKQVWCVLARGALLPEALWEQVVARSADNAGLVVLNAGSFGVFVTSAGKLSPEDALSDPGCPPVAELLGWRS